MNRNKVKGIAGIGLSTLVICALVISAGAAFASGPAGWPPLLDIEGSTTVDPICAAADGPFEALWPGTVVEVLGTGTGVGIEALQRDEIDIAMASRLPDHDDAAEVKPHPLNVYLIAKDALSPIVSDATATKLSGGADTFTIDGTELRWIWERGAAITTTTWRMVDELDGVNDWDDAYDENYVVPIARIIDSGTRDAFHDLVEYAGAPDEICPTLEEATITATGLDRHEHNDGVVSAVAAADFRIGYVGLGFIGKPGIQALKVADVHTAPVGVMPSEATVLDGTYPMSRSLYLITLCPAVDPTPNARAFDFINYMLTEAGQAHVTAEGFVAIPVPVDPPIRDYDVNIDNKVDMLDLDPIFAHWGHTNPAHHGWIRADVDNNGDVSMLDLDPIFGQWGKTWDDPTVPYPICPEL